MSIFQTILTTTVNTSDRLIPTSVQAFQTVLGTSVNILHCHVKRNLPVVIYSASPYNQLLLIIKSDTISQT